VRTYTIMKGSKNCANIYDHQRQQGHNKTLSQILIQHFEAMIDYEYANAHQQPLDNPKYSYPLLLEHMQNVMFIGRYKVDVARRTLVVFES